MGPHPTGLQLRENLENRQHEGKQMTVKMATSTTGAPSTGRLSWNAINWQKVTVEVRRLQLRIAKAHREGKSGKAKALQWLLTHSFSAKALAVQRVVQNRGAKTPGIDNVQWKTSSQRMQAALTLKRHGYNTKPLKRIYIPKKQKRKISTAIHSTYAV